MPSVERLHQVHGEDLTARASNALHDRDAFDFLPHEHARHARDRDASEHDDDEADQAEIIFGALEILADLFLTIAVRPHANELGPKLGLQTARQRIYLAVGHTKQHLAHHAAAKGEEARFPEDRRSR